MFSLSRLTFDHDGKQRDKTLGLRGIDVVSDAENIKKLLKMPYSSKTPVSMIVHRIGQSILIDDMDLHRLTGLLNATSGAGPLNENAFSRETDEWSWLKNFFYEIMLTSYESKEKALVRRNTTINAIQERNLISKFLHRSLENQIDGSPLRIKQSPTKQPILSLSMPPLQSNTEIKEKCEVAHELKNVEPINSCTEAVKINDTRVQLPPLPEPCTEDLNIFRGAGGIRRDSPTRAASETATTTKDFARTLLWNFEDIKMLIGSDMPIFGDKDHPSVSLRLHNAKKPIHILTGIDYWLDNLMCQVPEVLMCFHLDGIVQKYELYKTEDLPALSEGGSFSPGVIRDVAQNILSFLKMNAAKEGHTYWLFKGKDDDVVKLYDLTGLCKEYETKEDSRRECDENSCGFGKSTGMDSPNDEPKPEFSESSDNSMPFPKNPFRTAVSLLLYKAARNILQNTENRANDEASAKRLLSNCLQLLDKHKYPQIATSAHFMLSDLYVPDDIDPANPKAKFATNTACGDADQSKHEYLNQSNFESQKPRKGRKSSLAFQPATIDLKSITTTSRKAPRKQSGMRKHSKHYDDAEQTNNISNPKDTNINVANIDSFVDEDDLIFTSPPLTSSVVERCKAALLHASEGLISLKKLEERRNEDKIQESKAREQYERDNPKMCKPNEAIPMPYSNEDSKLVVSKPRSRCQSESAVTSLNKSKKPMRGSNLSWHDHLKTVLFKKATIIYVVLAETHFVAHNYGQALRCVKRSLNCYEMVCFLTGISSPIVNNSIDGQNSMSPVVGEMEKHVSSFISFAFGLAGDSYYNILQNWSEGVVSYQEEFNATTDTSDETIFEIIESHVDEAKRNWSIKVPKDIEEAMILASKCFDLAILLGKKQVKSCVVVEEVLKDVNDSIIGILDYEDEPLYGNFEASNMNEGLKSLLKRRGNLSNEMGVFYVNQADILVKSESLSFKDHFPQAITKILDISTVYLKKGLKDFRALFDIPNQALLLSNAGRHCRLSAYCYSLVETEDSVREIDLFRNENEKYKQAIQLYESALKILTCQEANTVGFGKGKRNQYSKIYESVSWDLQTTSFIWGSRLQDSTPKEAYTMDEVEKLVVDLYGRALRLCDIESPGPRQPVFQYRAASIHMKLGSLYHLKYRKEEDNGKFRSVKPGKDDHRRKNLKQLAENHYAKAVAMFKELEHGQEFLRAQLERVYLHESDLSKDKHRSQGFNTFTKKTYHTIFELLCESLPILRAINDSEKLKIATTKKKMIVSDGNKDQSVSESEIDEDEIHIYDILMKKVQNNLLELSKSMSVKNQPSKSSGKTNELLEITKKLYLKAIVLKSEKTMFLADLITLLEVLHKDLVQILR